MDVLKQLNDAVAYVEANLCDEIDLDRVAELACLSKDSFIRFFSYMTGMTLSTYIRRRRLSLAACELQNSKWKVIEIAVKYGWDSADAFAKAFIRQHGIPPTQARNPGQALKIYPSASFHMMIKGAREMNFRIIQQKETAVFGVSKKFDLEMYKTREELRHSMWADNYDNVPGQICVGNWNEPQSHFYDGVWYGIWQDGTYMIAREKANIRNEKLEKRVLPAGTYAAFQTERGGLAWEEFPKLRELIFDSWLPDSGYRQKGELVIEVLHLWTDHDVRNRERYYELWIPVEKDIKCNESS